MRTLAGSREPGAAALQREAIRAAGPLIINGKALPPGTYTLQAALYGSPVFSATTSFVVKNVIAIN